jgi:hypothetical protein
MAIITGSNMFRNGTIMAALLIIVIVIASSLAISSGFVSHAFAAKTMDYNGVTNAMVQPDDDTDKSNSPKSRSFIIGDSNAGMGNATGISKKALKHLSNCESEAAEDGHLKRGEVRDCYLEAFTLY